MEMENERTQVEIDSRYAYKNPEGVCRGCGIPLNRRLVLCNTPENCKECITYPYMEIGEGMHMECYIARVIEGIMKNYKPPESKCSGRIEDP